MPKTPQQEKGIESHKKWEEIIKEKKELVLGKTHLLFKNPKTELKINVSYNEFINLSGIIDCYDSPLAFDWKTGATSAFESAGKEQLPMYFLMLELIGEEPQGGYIVHYDDATNESSPVFVPNTKRKIESAMNFVDTIGSEMYYEFDKLGIL